MTDLPRPDYAHRMRIIGHSDQDGRPDGMQLMVHRGHAYVAHMFSGGFSVLDVSDARKAAHGDLCSGAGEYLDDPPADA